MVLAPFAPHIAEELWEKLGHTVSLAREQWPTFNPQLLREEMVEVILQVNGKIRSKLSVEHDTPEQDLERLCIADESVRRHTEGKRIVKAIVVKNKLVNLVVK